MDLGTLIMGAAIVAICMLPFVIIGNAGKKRKKRTLQSLTNMAKQYNGQISQYEFCANFAIGIDEAKNFVFFYKRSKDEVEEEYVDLSEIKKSKVVTTSRTVGNKDQNHSVIDRLDLAFVPKAVNKEEIKWAFFDVEENLQLSSELPMIEKWSNLINDRIKG